MIRFSPRRAAPQRSRLIARATVIGMAAALVACGVQPKSVNDPEYPARTEMHPLAPVVIEFHPLTRLIAREGEDPIIETYLQLFDRWGHSTKAVGELTIVLGYATAEEMSGAGLQQLMRWHLDLRDGDANAHRYDRVTRTYRIVLGATAALPERTDSLIMEATFVTEDGRRLRATYDLREQE